MSTDQSPDTDQGERAPDSLRDVVPPPPALEGPLGVGRPVPPDDVSDRTPTWNCEVCGTGYFYTETPAPGQTCICDACGVRFIYVPQAAVVKNPPWFQAAFIEALEETASERPKLRDPENLDFSKIEALRDS